MLLLVLSILVYWMSVATTPQLALLPLITLPMVLTPLACDPKARLGAMEGGRNLAGSIKTYIRQSQRYLFLCLLFIAFTTGAFFIRQFVFGIQYHYYELGWVDQSLQQVLRGLHTFLSYVVRSFKFDALLKLTPPPLEFGFSMIATLAVYSACLIRYARNTPALIPGVQKNEGFHLCWIALLFLLIAILTVFPATLIRFPQDRYFWGPGVFLTASVLISLSAFLNFFFGASRYTVALTVWVLLLLSSLMLSTYNRYLHIENTYIAKATIYKESRKLLRETLILLAYRKELSWLSSITAPVS